MRVIEFVEGMKNDKVWGTASSYFINKMKKLVMEGNGVLKNPLNSPSSVGLSIFIIN